MPYRQTSFVNNEYYHIYSRGIDRRNVFLINRDRSRFIKTLFYYQLQNPKPKFSTYRLNKAFTLDLNKKIVEIVCFSLMPNHFHLLLKQTLSGGISEFARRFIHSYTKYFNVKHKHEGPIFTGPFKGVYVESDEQLLHVSRYIHINPRVAKLVEDLRDYPWSSYNSFVSNDNTFPVAKEKILSFFKSPKDYEKFVLDQIAYGETLEMIKHEALDLDQEHKF